MMKSKIVIVNAVIFLMYLAFFIYSVLSVQIYKTKLVVGIAYQYTFLLHMFINGLLAMINQRKSEQFGLSALLLLAIGFLLYIFVFQSLIGRRV